MTSIDLNADLGENTGDDDAMLRIVTSANISCGVHAGDPLTLYRTLLAAEDAYVRPGAHPSYPDRANFGRVSMDITDVALHAMLSYQLSAFAALVGGVVSYVKPHGALYNDAMSNPKIAQTLVTQAAYHRADVMGLPGSEVERACDRLGVRFIAEAFADRAYLPSGQLAPRSQAGAVLHDPEVIAERVLRMVRDRVVTTVTGEDIEIAAESICVHGDTPGAVAIAQRIVDTLADADIAIRAVA